MVLDDLIFVFYLLFFLDQLLHVKDSPFEFGFNADVDLAVLAFDEFALQRGDAFVDFGALFPEHGNLVQLYFLPHLQFFFELFIQSAEKL